MEAGGGPQPTPRFWALKVLVVMSFALQHSATHCNTLQHTATHYNTLQIQAAIHCCSPQQAPLFWAPGVLLVKKNSVRVSVGGNWRTVTPVHRMVWDTLQHTRQHAAPLCNTLQHTAKHCNALQHPECNTLQHNATHCNILQHAAPRCNTLQHTVVMRLHVTLRQSRALQSVAVCCSLMLQSVAFCCNASQSSCDSMRLCVTVVCYRVLQSVAICCSLMLRSVAVVMRLDVTLHHSRVQPRDSIKVIVMLPS